jgi:hypothetical protein
MIVAFLLLLIVLGRLVRIILFDSIFWSFSD